jgi:hypothetical protein
MSSITLTNNLKTASWSIRTGDLVKSYVDIQLGFTIGDQSIKFDRFQFGFELKKNNLVLLRDAFPKENCTYVTTDQEYIESVRVRIEFETTYYVEVWSTNAGILMRDSFEFTTSKPLQPYDSWIWENKRWNPPYPMPTDGNIYKWDEQTLQWIQVNTLDE